MSEPTSTRAELSFVDKAYKKRLAGDREGSLIDALSVLETTPDQLDAAALVVTILIDLGRPVIAAEAAKRLVDAFVRRGDLPSATSVAHLFARAGEEPRALFHAIAKAFGRDSPRLSDVSPAPPPLPRDAKVANTLARLTGDALLERAEAALTSLLATDDRLDPEGPVPRLPLFGSLASAALERLLAMLKPREVEDAATVVVQGAEGHEAFVVVRGLLEVLRSDGPDTEPVRLALLGPGAIFGEMALVSDAPRAASVIALEPVQLLVASRPHLEALARVEPAVAKELGDFCRQRMVSNLIRISPVLCSVQDPDRFELIHRFDARTFETGEHLVHAGDENEGLYLIASGTVEVSKTDAEGDRLQIATLGPGDVVGEISLVLRRPAVADVIARHPTVALHLSPAAFQDAIREHPRLLNELYETAVRRDEETKTVVAQEAVSVDDVVLV